jgi:hypothetical protein
MSSIIKVDTIQDQDGNNIINENANTITIGKAGDTVTVASGATFVGGGIEWQSVQTTGFTAVAGNGYFCNTTSAGFTVTLPATPSAGDQVQLVDYAGTFDTNALVIDPNGEDIEGGASNLQLTGERTGVILTYIDSTQGWIATSGINEGTDALEPLPYSVDFLVIAGGGGGVDPLAAGTFNGGGAGAGGYRNSYNSESSGGGGSAESSLTFTGGTVYTITVGAGGSNYVDGNDSSISGSDITTITSTGGGAGAGTSTGRAGGSGGGGASSGGTGNPSAGSGTANQGYAGATGGGPPNYYAGGGGGAGEAGNTDGNSYGGDGVASTITGSSVTRGGGGGGAQSPSGSIPGGAGGGGDGGSNSTALSGTSGTANTGGGAGGSGAGASGAVSGGSGVVILRMPTASYSSTTTGSPTVTTDGTDTILTFTGSGSYTG